MYYYYMLRLIINISIFEVIKMYFTRYQSYLMDTRVLNPLELMSRIV